MRKNELQELKKLALEATPGPLVADRRNPDWVETVYTIPGKLVIGNALQPYREWEHYGLRRNIRGKLSIIEVVGPQWASNTAYIAAANPKVILEMIAEIERLGKENLELKGNK